MVDNPFLLLLVTAAMVLALLAIFTLFTYLFMRMAVNLKRVEMRKK